MTAIQFGLSISASAATDADPIGLAQRAEELGLDFVAASDHPGGSEASYETWTLLTWIAAATTEIGIATKVLCGPLRLPALTAKMAETLQRLSHGRLVLGLGAGFSDDEMLSFGLHRLSPGDKIDGLEESVQIIRALWSQPSVTFSGRIHHADQAEIEPKPDRPIPIWLGAFGDRALDLTGRLADGWIPSYGFAPPDVVTGMRNAVLGAADRAGRDPADITCAYNMELHVGADLQNPKIVSGTSEQVIDQLVKITDLGFTAMSFALVGPDEHHQLEALARDVIPAVRAAR
jgi:alkanesulfonate monooxygenase SsuD/methylene tetrahydromethanopterin reductase-like flavin-dependent oxidoreductase (luciferase family)